MKTKAKLILAMSVLTAGVVAAGATGTFAWFTTNRAAQLTYSKVTAQKNAGNLDVTMGPATDGSNFAAGTEASVKTGQSIATASIDTASKMSDVSSDNGYDFAKPIWKTVAGEGKQASSFKAGEWGVDYTTFWFKVTNSGNNPLDVYLNSTTAIKAVAVEDLGQKAKNVAAAKYTRVSIASTTGNASGIANVLAEAPSSNWLLENTAGTRDQMYVDLPAESERNKESTVSAVALPKGVKSFVLDSDTESKKISSVTSAGGSENAKLCSLTAKGTAYFAVSIWLEGVKADDNDFNAALGGEVEIILDLAGVEATPAA